MRKVTQTKLKCVPPSSAKSAAQPQSREACSRADPQRRRFGESWRLDESQRPETESGTCEFFRNKGCEGEPHSSQQLRETGKGSRDFINSQDTQLLGVLAFDRVIILWA